MELEWTHFVVFVLFYSNLAKLTILFSQSFWTCLSMKRSNYKFWGQDFLESREEERGGKGEFLVCLRTVPLPRLISTSGVQRQPAFVRMSEPTNIRWFDLEVNIRLPCSLAHSVSWSWNRTYQPLLVARNEDHWGQDLLRLSFFVFSPAPEPEAPSTWRCALWHAVSGAWHSQ